VTAAGYPGIYFVKRVDIKTTVEAMPTWVLAGWPYVLPVRCCVHAAVDVLLYSNMLMLMHTRRTSSPT
jgi:hypothetical protein